MFRCANLDDLADVPTDNHINKMNDRHFESWLNHITLHSLFIQITQT